MIEPAPAPSPVPVLLFCRVSSAHQDNAYQLTELEQYCAASNYRIVDVIANNISGRTGTRRPDLDQLFALAKKGGFRKVIVTSLERLGRSAKMIRATIDTLHALGISVVFKNQGFESLDASGEETFVTNIMVSLYAELAQEDNRMRSQKIRSGIANAREKHGVQIGRPVGWRKSDEKLLKEYAKLAKDLRGGLSLSQCMKLHHVSKNTVIKVKRAMADQAVAVT
ncbi:recombinase family protein [Rufibacter latericius]|uniref:Recombinase family protein n=1 Tax=Rufibacter latericius TaxID=2487040 RepID=A0A3M9MAU6_9BACT|nr:recombinase family protein [Rufibacter latericius]RNI22661.1 recombinase family protein [Rufibacter latericius]